MEPEEHKERIDRDGWLYRRCRDCGHALVLHWLEKMTNDTVLVGYCNNIEDKGGFCGCKEFMSPDNLDYIELLAKRKGLIPDDDTKGEGK